MFLHIGENMSIYKKNIVAILDKESADQSEDTLRLLETMDEKGQLVNTADLTKTYIITYDGKEEAYRLYRSAISSTTLINRK